MSNIYDVNVVEQTELTKSSVAASLAGGIIAASGKPHSVEEALSVFNDVYWTMYPQPNNGRFVTWQNGQLRRDIEHAREQ